MRKEIPTWLAVVVIVVVVLIVVGIYVVMGRRGGYAPTTPPHGWKPQPAGPYPMKKGAPTEAPQPAAPQPQKPSGETTGQ